MISTLELEGTIHIKITDKTGKVIYDMPFQNAVLAYGKEGVLEQLLATPSVQKPTHMELGTGSPTTEKLGAFITDSRIPFISKVRSGQSIIMKCLYPSGTAMTGIKEAGLFNSPVNNAAGMYCSAYFSTVNKDAGSSLELTWTLTVL